MQPEELYQRFPNLKPISGAPPLFTLNGVGLTIYGHRDSDAETRTYVKTHCMVIFFVPVLALGAYRVAKDPDGSGWYFIGKEPLSRFAKLANLAVLFIIFGLIGSGLLEGYRNDPSRRAAKDLAAAEQLFNQEAWPQAANAYIQAHQEFGDRHQVAETARNKFKHLLTVLPTLAPAKAIPVYELLLDQPTLVDRTVIVGQVLALSKQLKDQDPGAAYQLLGHLGVIRVGDENVAALQHDLLLRWHEKEPTALKPALELALEAEQAGDKSRCRELLVAAETNLGDSEGARMLAQIYLEEGANEAAFPLLGQYVTPRLKAAQNAAAEYETAWNTFVEREIDALQRGSASQAFYHRWEKADEATQQQMIEQHLATQSEKNTRVLAARRKVEEANEIVPLALELGAMQLEAAKSEQGEKRTEMLKKAEQTLVSIGGFVGEDDYYRMYLGQVKYRLGHETEGRAILESVLSNSQRDDKILLNMAVTVRELGDIAWARSLAEEAYQGAQIKSMAYAAAHFRSVIAPDLDDTLHWLSLSDPKNPQVVISLNQAEGQRAAEAGDIKKARSFFKKALAGYGSRQDSSEALNNQALLWNRLFRLDGDLTALEKGAEMMEKAVSLNPTNSILMLNAASTSMDLGVARLLAEQIDLSAVEGSAALSDLYFLVKNPAELAGLRDKVRASAEINRAVQLYERAMMLAPKNSMSYDELDSYFLFLNDGENLIRVQRSAAEAVIDVSDGRAYVEEVLASGLSESHKTMMNQRVVFYEKALATPHPDKPLTQVYARCGLASSEEGRLVFLGDGNAGRVLTEVAAAHARQPCLATLQRLRSAHLFAAHRRLLANAPEYAAMTKQSGDLVDTRTLVCALLASKHPLADTLAADPDIAKASALEERLCREWPEFASWSSWALLQRTGSTLATKIQTDLAQDGGRAAHEALAAQLLPTHPEHVMRAYLAAQAGGADRGAAVLSAARAQDIKVPIL